MHRLLETVLADFAIVLYSHVYYRLMQMLMYSKEKNVCTVYFAENDKGMFS